MFKLPFFLFLLASTLANGQYIRLGVLDNSVRGTHPSTIGYAIEFGISGNYTSVFDVDYGARIEKGYFGREDRFEANYISFVLRPVFAIPDTESNAKYIVGGGFRIGSASKKPSRVTYLQTWYSLVVGIQFGSVQLNASFDRSLRDAIFKQKGAQETGSLSLKFIL